MMEEITIINLIFFVEEKSAEVTLKNILPKIVGDISFRVITFNGKSDLLKKLPKRLKGFRNCLSSEDKIIILIDNDNKDCNELKNKLEKTARDAGFTTRTMNKKEFQVINRIVIQELESWFLGEIDAIRKSYPRISCNLSKRKKQYRNPDQLTNTCETLLRCLNKNGYYNNIKYLPKSEVAKSISKNMNPDNNVSPSFNLFKDTLLNILQ